MKQNRKSLVFCVCVILITIASGFTLVCGAPGDRISAGVNICWAKDYVQELVRRGIIAEHSDEASNPDSFVTKASFVKMLATALKFQSEKDNSFIDTNGHWAGGYIGAAISHGIIKPEEYEGLNFRPDDFITRIEAAQMVTRAMGKDMIAREAEIDKLDYKDISQIADNMKGYVIVMGEEGVFTGQPDGSFRPDECIKVAEAAAIIIRMFDRIDSRSLENITLAVFGTDERSTETSRSDIIMILKFYPNDKKVIMVSVPRDTRVKIDRYGNGKINSAYAYGGDKLLEATLEEMFNIKIDYHVRFGFKSFVAVIDALGGVKINAQKDFSEGDSVIVRKGENILNGEQALFYVCYRSDSDGDFGRIKRQQEVIWSISNKLIEEKNNILILPKLIRIFEQNAESDIGIRSLFQNAQMFGKLDEISFDFYTLKTYSKTIDGVWYELIDTKDLKRLQGILGEK